MIIDKYEHSIVENMVIEDFKGWLSKNDDGKGIYKSMHRKMTLEKLSSKSMSVHLSNMKRIVEMCPTTDFNTLDAQAIEDIQVALTERYKEPATLNIHILTLRKWLKVSGQEQLLSAITKVRGRSKRKLREELITEAELTAMIKACAHPRDAAIIALLSDSGCRVGELVKLQVKHITFNEDGAIVRYPDGKTGPGEDLIVDACSYMRIWLSAHEYADNPEAPLFYSLRGKYIDPKIKKSERILPENRKLIPLDEDGVRQQIRNIAKKAGIKRRIHPHLFRHTRATECALNMQESLMNIKFRWSPNSQTARVYTHVNEKDVQKVIRKMAGIKDTEEEVKAVEPVKCARCKEINSHRAEYCYKCGYPLSAGAIARMEEERLAERNGLTEMRKQLQELQMAMGILQVALAANETGMTDEMIADEPDKNAKREMLEHKTRMDRAMNTPVDDSAIEKANKTVGMTPEELADYKRTVGLEGKKKK